MCSSLIRACPSQFSNNCLLCCQTQTYNCKHCYQKMFFLWSLWGLMFMFSAISINCPCSRSLRYAAYRAVANYLWGRQGKKKRSPLPACIGNDIDYHLLIICLVTVNRIQEMFPSPDGTYVGFQDASMESIERFT